MRKSMAILFVFLATGSGCSKSTPVPDGDDRPAANELNLVSPASGEIRVPFQGVIRAKQWIGTPLNSSDVTYFIGLERIRREVVSTTLFDKTIRSPRRAGVICHPAANRVVLYCAEGEKKFSCTVSLSEYADICGSQTLKSSGDYYGFGRIFADMPPDYLAESAADAVSIGGFECDRLVVNFGGEILVIIEADHSPAVEVDPELFRLVELNPPDEMTGFPFRVRRVETLRRLRQAKSGSQSDYRQLIVKAANALSGGLEKVTECGLEIRQIEAKVLGDESFEVPDGFSELADASEFQREFYVPSGGSDWDD